MKQRKEDVLQGYKGKLVRKKVRRYKDEVNEKGKRKYTNKKKRREMKEGLKETGNEDWKEGNNNYCKTTRQLEKNMKDQKQTLDVGQGKKKGLRTYKRNTEARSKNHCWRGRAISITYSECVYVALVIWYVQRMLRNISSSFGCLALL